jgi:hypothetical protein
MRAGTKERLSVPGAGRTIASATEERAQHVRQAVLLLEPCLRSAQAEADFHTLFAPRWDGGALSPNIEPTSRRAAWVLVNVLLLARMAEQGGDFAAAERWFFGGHPLPSLSAHIEDDREALRTLSQVSFDEDLLELLPYVLEVHGPGSRLSVMRDPSTRVARDAKREGGVFYTPADVAEYMVGEALAGRGLDLRCLDPSCGNGVYLVAMLRTIARRRDNGKPFDRFSFAVRSLYGFDISTQAVESCTFALLHHCLQDVRRSAVPPWSAWHALRLNLAATDALRIRAVAAGGPASADAAETRERLRRCLVEGGHVEPLQEQLPIESGPRLTLSGDEHFPPLGAIFPEAEAGFEVLAGNPPYAAIGRRDDALLLSAEYACLRSSGATADLYPVFIEMMWRLTRPQDSSATLVVPLSIAYHQGDQFESCRQAMTLSGGHWRFAFFDRQPHALFGEDVKTRNAILFRSESASDPLRGTQALLETGPLTKWTSRTRERLFAGVSFTPLHGVDIGERIPKLCGDEQSQVFTVLAGRRDRLRTLGERCRTCRPHEATLKAPKPRVFVASTAYNFLNVFHSIKVEGKHPLSENTVHCMEFADQARAEMAFAILSSRLTFWLWHVEGDGFHVGGGFVRRLPFGEGSFNDEQAGTLQQAGRQLWDALQDHRIVSLNKGKQTVAYRPLALEKERDVIDDILIDAAGLSKRFRRTLRAFVVDAVVVDDTDARRSHMRLLFDAQEGEQ